jgi:hypothetical protein
VLAFLVTWSPAAATGAALVGFLLVLAGMWANHLSQNRPDVADGLFENDPLSYAPRRFTVTADGLVETRDGMTATVAWGRILQVTSEAGLLIVWITKLDATPIPLRCFGSAEAAGAFEAELRTRMRAAGNPAADAGKG